MHLRKIQLRLKKIDLTNLLHAHSTNMEIAKHCQDQWRIRYMKRENQNYVTIFHARLKQT